MTPPADMRSTAARATWPCPHLTVAEIDAMLWGAHRSSVTIRHGVMRQAPILTPEA